MSKAILVIDVPDKYSDRDIYVLHEIYTYEGNRYERIEEYKEGVHKLKPMPQKLAENFGNNIPTNTYIMNGTERQYLDMFAVGYNKCIDEILGAKNDR